MWYLVCPGQLKQIFPRESSWGKFNTITTHITSGSDDKTAKIWDASSSVCLQTKNKSFPSVSLNDICLESEDRTSNTGVGIVKSSQHNVYGFDDNQVWITRIGQNIPWLPSDYLPFRSTVTSSKLNSSLALPSVAS